MSVEKFKRILKLLITDFVRKSSHVAVHEVLNDVKNITATIEMVGDEKEVMMEGGLGPGNLFQEQETFQQTNALTIATI